MGSLSATRYSGRTSLTDLPPAISVLPKLLLPSVPNHPVHLILPSRVSLACPDFEGAFSIAVLKEGVSGAVEME